MSNTRLPLSDAKVIQPVSMIFSLVEGRVVTAPLVRPVQRAARARVNRRHF